jgi:predicted permease
MKILFRQFRHVPGHAVPVALLLALGIGANTAIFAVLQAVLLQPLPFPDADRLVTLNQLHQNTREVSISWPNAADWRAQNRSFSDFAITQGANVTLTGRGGAERVPAAFVTADLFSTLRVAPLLGRAFSTEEDRPGAPAVVVLSHGFWQKFLGGRPEALGEQLELDSVLHTVIGIMPADVPLPAEAQLLAPLTPRSANPEWQKRDNGVGLNALARLRPGVTLAQARTDLAALSERLARMHPENREVSAHLVPLRDRTVGAYRAPLWTLMAAVGLLLLIACANVASLQLTRGLARVKEFSIRAALGSSPGRLVRQLLAENLGVALGGAILGIGFAFAGLELIRAWGPTDFARFQNAQLSPLVLAFSVGTALAASIVAGLWPALRAARVDLRAALQSADKGGASSGRQFGRQAIVAGQVALTLVLLAGSLLFARSLERITGRALGFQPQNLLVFRVSLPPQNYRTAAARLQFLDQLQQRIARLPGVASAGYNLSTPLRTNWQTRFNVEGRPPFPEGTGPLMEVGVTGRAYFETLGVPLLRGRHFEATDVATAPRVALIDQAFAEKMWPGEDAVGKAFLWDVGLPAGPRVTVVGVVPTLEMNSFAAPDRLFQVYVPLAQLGVRNVSFVVRTTVPPRSLLDTIKGVVAEADALVPVYDPTTMEEMIAATHASQTLTSRLVALFGGAALLLAGVGLYGVVAYAVHARRQELAVRLALGATPRQVVGLVLRDGARPLAFGLALGLLGVAAAGRLVAALLFGVTPLDPLALAGSTLALLIVAAIALWLPARRAARAQPIEALRNE